MRGNLPSVTHALFQEVVSCPELAVVARALETARVLAGYLSNQAGAEADWQGVVRGFVHKGVAEVKANPDSMMGRCVHSARAKRWRAAATRPIHTHTAHRPPTDP